MIFHTRNNTIIREQNLLVRFNYDTDRIDRIMMLL